MGDSQKTMAPRAYMEPREFPTTGVAFSLAYDSLKANIYAIARLIQSGTKAINGESIAKEIRENTDFIGLSGELTFDKETGDRNQFIGTASILWPIMSYTKKFMQGDKILDSELWQKREQFYSNWINILRFERSGDSLTYTRVLTEHAGRLYEDTGNAKTYRDIFSAQVELTDWSSKAASLYSTNLISKTECAGMFSDVIMSRHIPYVVGKGVVSYWDKRFPKMLYGCTKVKKTSPMIMSFYCSSGCGGKSSLQNQNKYENGECVRQDNCQCKPGWIGESR